MVPSRMLVQTASTSRQRLGFNEASGPRGVVRAEDSSGLRCPVPSDGAPEGALDPTIREFPSSTLRQDAP